MRTLRSVVAGLVCALLLFSCKPDATVSSADMGSAKTYQVDPLQAQPRGVASEIFSHYTFLPLETRSECLIGSIDEIIPYKGYYYLLDKQSKAIFSFDAQGKFVWKIAAEGEGPGEYSALNHLAIDTAQSCIVAMCLQKVICYNLADGRFKKEATFKTGIPEAMVATDTFCHYQNNLHWNGDMNNLRIITKNRSLFEYLPINTDFKGYCLRGVRFFSGNPTATVYFNDYLSNTVYEVTPTRLIARTIIDFGDKQITPEGIRQLGEAQTSSQLTKSWVCSEIREYLETPSFLQFSYGYQGRVYTFLHSKKNQHTYHFRNTWYDDVIYGLVPERWMFANDSALLTWKGADQFLRERAQSPEYYQAEVARLTAETKDPTIKARYETQIALYDQLFQQTGIDKLKETDNPILIWMNLNAKMR